MFGVNKEFEYIYAHNYIELAGQQQPEPISLMSLHERGLNTNLEKYLDDIYLILL